MGHVIEGNLSRPKNNCLRAFPIYWPVLNFMMHVFCESVIRGFVQNSLESSLSMFLFPVHFSMFGNFLVSSVKLLSRSYRLRCLRRNLIGHLSWVSSMDGHSFLW